MSKVNVFVSYSWGVEERTQYVSHIERLCPQNNVQLIRDNNEIRHGDSIDEFMKQIAGGEHIIIVLSDSYLKSDWCMYELLETWGRRDFRKRTHLIIEPDCHLQDMDYRLQVRDYWLDKAEKTKSKLAKYNPEDVSLEYTLLKLYQQIAMDINEILNFIRKLFTTSVDILQQTNFQALFDKIHTTAFVVVPDEEVTAQPPPAYYFTIDHHQQRDKFPSSEHRLFIGAYAATANDYPLSVAMHCYTDMCPDHLKNDVRQYVKVIDLGGGSPRQCFQESLKKTVLYAGMATGGKQHYSGQDEQQAVQANLSRYRAVVLFCEINTESRRKNLSCIAKGAQAYLESLQLLNTRVVVLFKYEQPAKMFGIFSRRNKLPEECCDWGALQWVKKEDVTAWLDGHSQRNIVDPTEKQNLINRLEPLFDNNGQQPYRAVLTALEQGR